MERAKTDRSAGTGSPATGPASPGSGGGPAGGAAMRAVIQQAFGPAGVWRTGERLVPVAGPGQVLVAVEAAAIDRGTWHLMTGRPYAARLAFGLRRPKNPVPGFDLAGRVAAVGLGVDGFAVGDAVFGAGEGSCAEYAVADVGKLAAKPAPWSWSAAAATAISGVSAWQALHRAGRVAAGQRVLILGASGGVGSFAVQLAKAAGAVVTGVSSSATVGFVRELGADQAIGYDVAAQFGPDPFDLVIDIGGGRSIAELRRLTAPAGTIVLVGAEGGGAVLGGVGRSIRGALLSPWVSQRIVMLAATVRGPELAQLAGLGRAGKLIPAVDRTFALDEAAAAMDALVAGGNRGKIALRIGAGALSER